MNTKYRKFKHSDTFAPEELEKFKETQFDFDPSLFGAFVLCDSVLYDVLPEKCKPDAIPISFKNGNYRADGVADGFMDESECVYVSESEMDACICIEWPL